MGCCWHTHGPGCHTHGWGWGGPWQEMAPPPRAGRRRTRLEELEQRQAALQEELGELIEMIRELREAEQR